MKKKPQQICMTVWRNQDGEFVRPPKEKPPKGKNRARVLRDTKITVTGRGGPGKVRRVRVSDPELIKAKKAADPDTRRQIRQVERSIAREALEEISRGRLVEAMQTSHASNRSQKAAASKKRRQAVQAAKFKGMDNNSLIRYKPADVYEARARRKELRARGLPSR